nr:hypothetical protein CFP56_62685 [Quercus suber]
MSLSPDQIVSLSDFFHNASDEQSIVSRFHAFRLDALRTSPEAFASSYEIEVQRDLDQSRQRLKNPNANHLIAVRSVDGMLPLVEREWLGMIVLLGPEDNAVSATVSATSDPFARMTSNNVSKREGKHMRSWHYHLNGVFVRPAARRTGLGKALIQAALDEVERRARRDGVHSVRLTISVDSENEKARRLYEAAGFRASISLIREDGDVSERNSQSGHCGLVVSVALFVRHAGERDSLPSLLGSLAKRFHCRLQLVNALGLLENSRSEQLVASLELRLPLTELLFFTCIATLQELHQFRELGEKEEVIRNYHGKKWYLALSQQTERDSNRSRSPARRRWRPIRFGSIEDLTLCARGRVGGRRRCGGAEAPIFEALAAIAARRCGGSGDAMLKFDRTSLTWTGAHYDHRQAVATALRHGKTTKPRKQDGRVTASFHRRSKSTWRMNRVASHKCRHIMMKAQTSPEELREDLRP